MADFSHSLAGKSRVSLVSIEEFDSAVRTHAKTENSKATAQISGSLPTNELVLLEALGQFGEIKSLSFSQDGCRATFYEKFSLETLLNQSKTASLGLGSVVRRYSASRTKHFLSRSKSSDSSIKGTNVPVSRSMFKSKELYLENSLQIQKSRCNEVFSGRVKRSLSAKSADQQYADAGFKHRKLLSELLFLEIGKKEQLPYHYKPEVTEESKPCKAAHSILSADDESDGYTVLPRQEKPLNRVQIVPSILGCEEMRNLSEKTKSALLLVKTQCNSKEGLSYNKQVQHFTGFQNAQQSFFVGTHRSASDEGLFGHSIVQVERQAGYVPVTVVTDFKVSDLHFFMYPLH